MSCPQPPPRGCSATRTSGASSPVGTARCWTSAAPSGSGPWRSVRRCTCATAAAGDPAATDPPRGPMPITSSGGPRTVSRVSTTASCCAAVTIGWSTRVVGPCPSTSSPPLRRSGHRPAARSRPALTAGALTARPVSPPRLQMTTQRNRSRPSVQRTALMGPGVSIRLPRPPTHHPPPHRPPPHRPPGDRHRSTSLSAVPVRSSWLVRRCGGATTSTCPNRASSAPTDPVGCTARPGHSSPRLVRASIDRLFASGEPTTAPGPARIRRGRGTGRRRHEPVAAITGKRPR